MLRTAEERTFSVIKLTFVCYNKNIRPMITEYTVACVVAQPSCDYHQLLELDCVLYVSKHFSDKYAYEQKQLWMMPLSKLFIQKLQQSSKDPHLCGKSHILTFSFPAFLLFFLSGPSTRPRK